MVLHRADVRRFLSFVQPFVQPCAVDRPTVLRPVAFARASPTYHRRRAALAWLCPLPPRASAAGPRWNCDVAGHRVRIHHDGLGPPAPNCQRTRPVELGSPSTERPEQRLPSHFRHLRVGLLHHRRVDRGSGAAEAVSAASARTHAGGDGVPASAAVGNAVGLRRSVRAWSAVRLPRRRGWLPRVVGVAPHTGRRVVGEACAPRLGSGGGRITRQCNGPRARRSCFVRTSVTILRHVQTFARPLAVDRQPVMPPAFP